MKKEQITGPSIICLRTPREMTELVTKSCCNKIHYETGVLYIYESTAENKGNMLEDIFKMKLHLCSCHVISMRTAWILQAAPPKNDCLYLERKGKIVFVQNALRKNFAALQLCGHVPLQQQCCI